AVKPQVPLVLLYFSKICVALTVGSTLGAKPNTEYEPSRSANGTALATSVRPLCDEVTTGTLAPSSLTAFTVATTCAVLVPTRITSGLVASSSRIWLVMFIGVLSTHCEPATTKRSG